MGVCASSKGGSPEDAAATNQIDANIKQEKMADQFIYKLLLLGAGESGKSTLFKQMISLYGDGFGEADILFYKPVVYKNIVSGMEVLLTQTSELPDQFGKEFEDCRLVPDSDAAAAAVEFVEAKKPSETSFPVDLHRIIKTLWEDPAIQNTFERRSLYQLSDSTQYFMEHLDRIADEMYKPTKDDILHARIRTTGIYENEFNIDGAKFKMFDVGGQRNERKKWIHCFSGVTGIIFVAALSGYDQVLFEDENVNRLDEALNLFENICNSTWFLNTAIILFLNKKDVFEEKIKKVSLTKFFPAFKEQQSYETGLAFVEQEFVSRNHKVSKQIFIHTTCATDSDHVKIVFDDVKAIIVNACLHAAGLG